MLWCLQDTCWDSPPGFLKGSINAEMKSVLFLFEGFGSSNCKILMNKKLKQNIQGPSISCSNLQIFFQIMFITLCSVSSPDILEVSVSPF